MILHTLQQQLLQLDLLQVSWAVGTSVELDTVLCSSSHGRLRSNVWYDWLVIAHTTAATITATAATSQESCAASNTAAAAS